MVSLTIFETQMPNGYRRIRNTVQSVLFPWQKFERQPSGKREKRRDGGTDCQQ